MHLVARRALSVRIAGETLTMEKGEGIHTENSYKYTPGDFEALLAWSGFDVRARWTDSRRWFGVFYCEVG
jgi:L-histidine N-alpha-methyltransferase